MKQTAQQKYIARRQAEGAISVTVLLDRSDARKLAKIMKHAKLATRGGALRYALWHTDTTGGGQ